MMVDKDKRNLRVVWVVWSCSNCVVTHCIKVGVMEGEACMDEEGRWVDNGVWHEEVTSKGGGVGVK